MPAVTFDGAVVDPPWYPLRQNADQQTARENNSTEVQERCLILKTMAATGIEQCHLFLPYRNVLLSLTRLGLTTITQTNLLKEGRTRQ